MHRQLTTENGCITQAIIMTIMFLTETCFGSIYLSRVLFYNYCPPMAME